MVSATNDILDLDGWHVIEKRRIGDEYEIEAEYTVQPEACLKCGVIGKLYRHGPKPIIYRDSPIRGMPVRLVAKAQRFKCRECGGTFQRPLKDWPYKLSVKSPEGDKSENCSIPAR